MQKTPALCAAFVSGSCIVSAACAQAPVRVPEAKMTLVPPASYTKMERSQLPPAAQKSVFAYYGPTESKFRANMTLVVLPVPSGVKADSESASHLGDSIKQSNPSYKQVAVGALTVNGEKGAYLVCSFNIENLPVQNKQVIFIRNGKVYDFCFMSSASAYPKQITGFDKSVASVKWQ